MRPARLAVVVVGCVVTLTGCAEKRVHVLPEVQGINRVAVINLGDRTGKPSPESEFFTNEFVSVGFSVVERGHLQEVLKEAFTSAGYLDERTVAEQGKGLGIEGVVLHQILSNSPTAKGKGDYDVTGWVRLVDVETGKIVLTYNAEVRVQESLGQTRATKLYAERVVDDIRLALQQKKIRPGTAAKIQVKQVEVKKTETKP